MRPELQTMYDHGAHFFPLAGKQPVTPHGFKDATRDLPALRRMFTRYPGGNIGGFIPGTVCIDVDVHRGGTINGLDIDLDATLVVQTGSDGFHIYYRSDADRIRGKLAGADGVDLKHWRTGYLVQPTSIHPATGRPYRIISSTAPIALPAHLVKRVEQQVWSPPAQRASHQQVEKKNVGLVRRVADATDGGRNGITYWAFCRALERGADSSLINDIRNAALSTGLSEREVDTCMRSARNTIKGAVA